MVAGAFALSGAVDRAAPYLCQAGELLPSSNLMAELQSAAFLAQTLVRAVRGGAPTSDDVAARRTAPCFTDDPVIRARYLSRNRLVGRPVDHRLRRCNRGVAVSDRERPAWSGRLRPQHAGAYRGSMGELESCQARVDQGRRDVEPHGVGCMPVYSYAALGLAALRAGNLSDAVANLQDAWDLSARLGTNNPNVIPFAGDLVEALARLGELKTCAPVLSWLNERARTTGLVYPRAVASRAQGILTTDPEAQRLFAGSLAALDEIGPIPFEEARTLLCVGEALRRARRPSAARTPLDRSLTLFEGLGARPWSAHARAELAASGRRIGGRSSATVGRPKLEELTPQELQVARAAGRGLNNLEIAAALFVSRKTVEAHLTRVYSKLGIRSRTELARILLAHGVSD